VDKLVFALKALAAVVVLLAIPIAVTFASAWAFGRGDNGELGSFIPVRSGC
jgi:hypothetical protein